MNRKQLLGAIVLLVHIFLPFAGSSFAQTFPRNVALSDRVGETIDAEEQAYFNLFPSDRPFEGAIVNQLSDSTFTITIDRGPQNEYIDLNLDRFYALRKYIDEFEIRYTGAFSEDWDYIIFYTDPLRHPFGPGSLYELTLTSGEKKTGHILWASEGGVYLSQMIDARSPELTASRLSYHARETLLRVSPQKRVFKSFGQGPDVIFAGEPVTYTNVTLPQLLKDALYPRALPPEVIARAKRNALVPATPPVEPEWSTYTFPQKSSRVEVLFYLPTLKYYAPPGFNDLEITRAFAASTGTEKKPHVDIKSALFLAATRFSLAPRLRAGVSLSQAAPNKTPTITNRQLEGELAPEQASDLRRRPGSLTVGGTHIGFGLTYLLRAAPDYLTHSTARSNRLDFDIKITAGPSLGLTNTVAKLESVGRVRTGDGATFTSNTTYGIAEKFNNTLVGGHATLEINAFLNRSWSIGVVLDTILYVNYDIPEVELLDFFGIREKSVAGPTNNKLWLSTVFFGLSYYF